MLYGVLITYNDMPHIKTTIESIYDKVDMIVAVDGRFLDFPSNADCSTDGTIEYLRSLDKVSLVIAEGKTEVEKRNLYLVGSVGDWYLHLDADEEWVGDVKWEPDVDMMISTLRRKKPKQFMDRIRLFRHVEGLHYDKKHYWLFDSHQRTFAILDKPGQGYKAGRHDGVKIIHHEDVRTPERMSEKKQYYRALCKIENRIREVV